jgi:predicted nucleotidyltransferase
MSEDGKTIIQTIANGNPFNPNNALNIYHYGSYVYGTNDEESDLDIIMVHDCDGLREKELQFNTDNLSCTVYSRHRFVDLVRGHDISSLECIWIPNELKIKETIKFVNGAEYRCTGIRGIPKLPENHYVFHMCLTSLRKEISSKSSNSFVKAKKKFEVEKQYRLGKKSLFHALRIVMFGTQIASEGKITNYQCANEFWERIKSNPSQKWSDYKKIYKPIYNGLMTEFRRLAPKEGIKYV